MIDQCEACDSTDLVYSEEFNADIQAFIEIIICSECGTRHEGGILE